MSDSSTAVTVAPSNGFALAALPGSPEAAYSLCEKLASSNLIPKAFFDKPGDIFVAGAMGARLGLDIFSALSGIAVVNGRPTLWGDAMLAVCQQRADFAGLVIEWSGEGEAKACSVLVHRKGHAAPYVGKFSVADAKRAGLWGKAGPWTQYPERMIELRARAFALRTAFADALSGFHAREEFDDADAIDVTGSAVVRSGVAEAVTARVATTAATADPAAGDPAKAEPAKVDPKSSIHPARTAAKALFKNLGNYGRDVITRLSKLHGGTAPADIPVDRLDAFGEDVECLAAIVGDLPAVQAKLTEWEQQAEADAKAGQGAQS